MTSTFRRTTRSTPTRKQFCCTPWKSLALSRHWAIPALPDFPPVSWWTRACEQGRGRSRQLLFLRFLLIAIQQVCAPLLERDPEQPAPVTRASSPFAPHSLADARAV